jgi:hypothetical protein
MLTRDPEMDFISRMEKFLARFILVFWVFWGILEDFWNF